jgi:hypothetical protein
VCQLEHQLFEHFFPEAGAAGDALAPLMDPLCTLLYDALRPAFIQLQSLDDLCALVDILQHEVLEEQLGRRGDAVAPLRPVLLRTLADVQERLTFRAQAFIKEEVAGFAPKPEDLDYPGKLERQDEGEAAASAEQPLIAAAAQNGGDDAHQQRESGLNAYATWYPPVQQTLLCLSKLYRCVERRVFAGLAQDAVSSCALAVQVLLGCLSCLCAKKELLLTPRKRTQAAARLVTRRSSPMDGQLFLVKQLLILREQIAPFEADFSVTEKDLDFSHMRDHLRRILAGQASLFALSADNAMVQFMSRGAPRILENQVVGRCWELGESFC